MYDDDCDGTKSQPCIIEYKRGVRKTNLNNKKGTSEAVDRAIGNATSSHVKDDKIDCAIR